MHQGLKGLPEKAGEILIRAILVVEHGSGAFPLHELLLVLLLGDAALHILHIEPLSLGQRLWDADIDGSSNVTLVVGQKRPKVQQKHLLLSRVHQPGQVLAGDQGGFQPGIILLSHLLSVWVLRVSLSLSLSVLVKIMA